MDLKGSICNELFWVWAASEKNKKGLDSNVEKRKDGRSEKKKYAILAPLPQIRMTEPVNATVSLQTIGRLEGI